MTVQITSHMMMEGAVKARKRGINLKLYYIWINKRVKNWNNLTC
jgi:hypothetical protein